MDRITVKPHQKSTGLKLVILAICGLVMGYFIGSSLPGSLTLKAECPRFEQSAQDEKVNSQLSTQLSLSLQRDSLFSSETKNADLSSKPKEIIKIYVTTNPRGAESLPPGIIESFSDLHLYKLEGNPSEDLEVKPKYLLALTVGYLQKNIVDNIISKFSENFSFVLFHYDGRTSEWDQFEWSQRAIHVSARKQTKWWYAKRFLHPDIVAPYEYIFIWDEDLGAEHFNAEEYIKLVKKYGLEISQPGLEPNNFVQWSMTKRRDGVEVHKETEERPGWCHDPYLPPCAGFVEIMAPVFSRESWRCVWHMIQNDLVHGWGLDLALQKCVQPAHEKIGVVDAQWIEHKILPLLGDQGEAMDGRAPWEGVRERCNTEWREFESRMDKAEQEYHHLSMH